MSNNSSNNNLQYEFRDLWAGRIYTGDGPEILAAVNTMYPDHASVRNGVAAAIRDGRSGSDTEMGWILEADNSG